MPPTVKGMGKITLHKPKLNYTPVTLFGAGGNEFKVPRAHKPVALYFSVQH